MNKKTTAGAGLPLGPVIVTGLSAIAGVVLLAVEQPAPGVLACLLGMAAGFALWMRELGVREQAFAARVAAAEAASQSVAASKPAGAAASGISNEWFSGVEGQLSSARNQVEAAVNDLGHTLGQLRGRLQDAQQAAAQACDTLDSSGAGVAGEVQGRLDAMLDSINQSLAEKTAIFQEVRGFVNATDELARMASSVEELAAKTNLLALNAAIEAARAGEEGRGFSIVADEVRKLSMLSAETGQQIRQRVQDISAAARRAGEGADRMQGSDARLLDHAHSTVSEVVQTFGRATGPLQSVARQISDQASQAASDVDQVESGLGFQSDVSALIASVDDSIRTLRGQIASGGDIDMRAVMRPLNERAAMPSARPVARPTARAAATPAAPRPATASAPAAGSSGGGLDITFF